MAEDEQLVEFRAFQLGPAARGADDGVQGYRLLERVRRQAEGEASPCWS